jgi:hypothetical protein
MSVCNLDTMVSISLMNPARLLSSLARMARAVREASTLGAPSSSVSASRVSAARRPCGLR